MATCAACGRVLGEGVHTCPECGGTAVPGSVRRGAVLFGPGELLAGRYRVEACLGTGASGAVYGVRDGVLDRPFALKVFWEAMAPEDPAFAPPSASLFHEEGSVRLLTGD